MIPINGQLHAAKLAAHRMRPLTISGCASSFDSTSSFRIPTKTSTSFRNASGCASRKWLLMYSSKRLERSGTGFALLDDMGRKLD